MDENALGRTQRRGHAIECSPVINDGMCGQILTDSLATFQSVLSKCLSTSLTAPLSTSPRSIPGKQFLPSPKRESQTRGPELLGRYPLSSTQSTYSFRSRSSGTSSTLSSLDSRTKFTRLSSSTSSKELLCSLVCSKFLRAHSALSLSRLRRWHNLREWACNRISPTPTSSSDHLLRTTWPRSTLLDLLLIMFDLAISTLKRSSPGST